MKTAISIMLLSLPLLSLASVNSAFQTLPISTVLKVEKVIILLEQNGISVSAENFSLEGKEYTSLKFKNTTSEAIRILWSMQLNGVAFPVHMDGTTQAYLTIPAGESMSFGQANSNDPLIDIMSIELGKQISIQIEIQD